MFLEKLGLIAVSAAIVVLVSGCAQLPEQPRADSSPPQAPVPVEPAPLYEWQGTGRVITRIHIDTDAQKAEFYDGEERVGWAHVATGINHFETPWGTFKVTEKVADKHSNIYGTIYDAQGNLAVVNAKRGVHRMPPGGRFEGASMPYFMRLTSSGVGLHGGPIPAPGTPASHGCIRLPEDLAPIIFHHVQLGTPVQIFGTTGPGLSPPRRADTSPGVEMEPTERPAS